VQITRRGILILLLGVAIFSATTGSSAAQNIIRLEQLQVDLWPEYDQPEMLVIYRGLLAPDTPLPATLTLRLPERVGQPNAVAYADETGALLNAPYSTQVEGDWLEVTLEEIPTTNFHLEFYDDLNHAGQQRSYTFAWPGDYAVGQFNLLLLPPPGAAGLQTTPELSQLEASDGSYRGTFGSLSVGQEARLMVSYDGSAVSSPPPAPSGELSSNEDDGGLSPLVVGVVIGVLLALVAVGVWYSRRPQPQSAPAPSLTKQRSKRSRSQRRQLPQSQRAPAQASPAGHCTQCGHALMSNDRFCGGCGAPVEN
jgi:hypothetical protein